MMITSKGDNHSRGNAVMLLFIALLQLVLVWYEWNIEDQPLWACIFGLMAFLSLCASIFEWRGRI